MRISRWLLAAGLGVGVLAQADSHHDQAEALTSQDQDWSHDIDETITDDDDYGRSPPANYVRSEHPDILDSVDETEWTETVNEFIDNLDENFKETLESNEDAFDDFIENLSDDDKLLERALHGSQTTAVPASSTHACEHCASPAVPVTSCTLCSKPVAAENFVERDLFKPKAPEPENLVSKIPAHVTPGWKTTSSSRIHGHRWKWSYTVTATDPTEFKITYHDHHHHTSTAFGTYISARRPHVSIDYMQSGLDVLEEAIIHEIVGDRLAVRGSLNIGGLLLDHLPSQVSSGQILTTTTSEHGTSVTQVITVTNVDPLGFKGTVTTGKTTATMFASIDTDAEPPVVAVTAISQGTTLLRTTTPIPITDATDLGDFGEPPETAAPVARRLYEALPPRVTPGQVYTHTNIENGMSTTATITVTATMPNTGFAITMHNGTVTRTCMAYINKTATPPKIVQTVTGAGLSFVQTDTWNSVKEHAFLPHASPKAGHSTHKEPHSSSAVTSKARTGHLSNGTLSAHTVVLTHIKTKTIKAAKTHTVTASASEMPAALSKSKGHWTVTATRLSHHGDFNLPSQPPKALLNVSQCTPEKTLQHRYDDELEYLMAMTAEDLKKHYSHLGWPYMEFLIHRMRELEDMSEREATALAIRCMRDQIDPSDVCPCDSQPKVLNDPFQQFLVSTKYIARIDSTTSATVTPPCIITYKGRTIPFKLATHASKTRSGSDGAINTRPLGTMTVILDDAPRSNLNFPCRTKATPHCEKGHGNYDKKRCDVEKCMWEHLAPINITTAIPAVMTNDYGSAFFDYFTHVTHISGRAHYGTTESTGIYYPVRYQTMTAENGCRNKTAIRELPQTSSTKKTDFPRSMINRGLHPEIHGHPKCWNKKTCHEICTRPKKSLWQSKTFRIIAGIVAGLAALFLLGCLGCLLLALLHRRHKKPKQERAGDSFVGHNVDPVTGRAVDPATGGETVAAMSALGPAAAAAAKPGPKKAGTFGRQAEEGRGRVHFPDGGTAATAAGAGAAGAAAGEKAGGGEKGSGGDTAAGGEKSAGREKTAGGEKTAGSTETGSREGKETGASGGEATTSEKEAEPPAEHVETVPAHDGADSRRTGSEMFDTGSMRGRRPIRQNDQGLI